MTGYLLFPSSSAWILGFINIHFRPLLPTTSRRLVEIPAVRTPPLRLDVGIGVEVDLRHVATLGAGHEEPWKGGHDCSKGRGL